MFGYDPKPSIPKDSNPNVAETNDKFPRIGSCRNRDLRMISRIFGFVGEKNRRFKAD